MEDYAVFRPEDTVMKFGKSKQFLVGPKVYCMEYGLPREAPKRWFTDCSRLPLKLREKFTWVLIKCSICLKPSDHKA